MDGLHAPAQGQVVGPRKDPWEECRVAARLSGEEFLVVTPDLVIVRLLLRRPLLHDYRIIGGSRAVPKGIAESDV